MATIQINGTPTQVPAGAIAWKYADPTEAGRWVFEARDAEDIAREDPSLLVRLVSVDEVVNGGLPIGAAGVHWADTDWTECRAHLEDPSWSTFVTPNAEREGIVLSGEVDCDACRERDAAYDDTYGDSR